MTEKEMSSRALRLVERILFDQDPFNVMKTIGSEIPAQIISEAWTAARKKEVIANASKIGYSLIDHVVLGDFDITLWKVGEEQAQSKDFPPVVAINNSQYDPSDPNVQDSDNLLVSLAIPRRDVTIRLKQWIEKHGSLIVGSVVPSRNPRYLTLFKKLLPGYKIEPYYGKDFKHGFKISK